jgi:hypothetical protein
LTLGFLFRLVQEFFLEDLEFGRWHPIDLRREEEEKPSADSQSFADFWLLEY